MLLRLTVFTLLISCAAFAQVRRLAARSICAEGILSKNFESNEVLGKILDDYYVNFERQFREQGSRLAGVEFFYDGTAPGKMAVWFPAGHVVDYASRRSRCDGELSSSGDVKALSPVEYRVTLYVSLNGILSEEDSRLSEAEKGNKTIGLWAFQNESPPFTAERLTYTAHMAALKAAFALAAARK